MHIDSIIQFPLFMSQLYHSAVTECEKKMGAKCLEGYLNLPEQEPVMIAEAEEQ